jgi:protein-tyrosine phosphatase
LSRTFTLREAAHLVRLTGSDVDLPGESLAERARALVRHVHAARSHHQGSEADDVRDPIGLPPEVHLEVGEAIAEAFVPLLARIAAVGAPRSSSGAPDVA